MKANVTMRSTIDKELLSHPETVYSRHTLNVMKNLFMLALSFLLTLSARAQEKQVLDLPLLNPGIIELAQMKNLKTLEFSKSFSQNNPLHFAFYSCQVVFVPREGDPLEFSVRGPHLEKNKLWSYMLSKMSMGGKIFFEDIKGVGEDGTVRSFGGVALLVN